MSDVSIQGIGRAAQPGPVRRRRWAVPRDRGWRWWLAMLVLVLGGLGMVAPFLWMFATSFRSALRAYDLPPVWFTTPNLTNYDAAVSGPVPLLRNMTNSAIVALAVTVGSSSPARWPGTRSRGCGSGAAASCSACCWPR